MNRLLWHLFGLVVSFLFAVGFLSFFALLSDSRHVPFGDMGLIGAAVMAVVGFFGAVRYCRWYRS